MTPDFHHPAAWIEEEPMDCGRLRLLGIIAACSASRVRGRSVQGGFTYRTT